jgi:hypothetical protein
MNDQPGADLEAEERALFARHDDRGDPAALFILGAPRTGSTVLFQSVVAAFDLPYISNRTNAVRPKSPAPGVVRDFSQRAARPGAFESRYGKTDGELGLSEGSAVMAHWCGGGHPSEIMSAGVLPNRAAHMRATLRAIETACGAPLVVKNAWNCFRLADLARHFPRAGFVWIRRDIFAAAVSDLAARYAVQGDPKVWNSATPRNVEALRSLSPAAQVLENQFEFARAIGDAATALPPNRFAEVWYEDLCSDPAGILSRLSTLFDSPCADIKPIEVRLSAGAAPLPESDRAEVELYCRKNADRFAPLRRMA